MSTILRTAVLVLAVLVLFGVAATATAGAHATDLTRDPVSTVAHVCGEWGLANDWGDHHHGDGWAAHAGDGRQADGHYHDPATDGYHHGSATDGYHHSPTAGGPHHGPATDDHHYGPAIDDYDDTTVNGHHHDGPVTGDRPRTDWHNGTAPAPCH